MNAFELLSTLLYTVVAALLTAGGIAAEYVSFQHLASGELVVMLWFGVLGAIMLYAGVYGIGYQKLLARALSS